MNTQELILAEERRQKDTINLIASENYASDAVRAALGSVFTNKYAEGLPGKRYYGGCEFVDQVESRAIELAKLLFEAEHVSVQPLSGAAANLAVYSAFLKPGDTVLGMDLSHGGHLTHGHPVTWSAKLFRFTRYKTTLEGLIDYDALEATAKAEHPKIILVGYSSYSRDLDYARVKAIAESVGAIAMADVSHTAGLIVAGEMQNPVPLFDVVTATTHKTLRGPRGAMIFCKVEHAAMIDRAVFPGLQGGPHVSAIAALAVALEEASRPEFRAYAKQVKLNAARLASELDRRGYRVVFGGTENHLVLVDMMYSRNRSGGDVQTLLERVGITVNKNVIPDDSRPPQDPSGIRLGTPAVTTRGMKEDDMVRIAAWIDTAIEAGNDEVRLDELVQEVRTFVRAFPLCSKV